MMLGDVSSVPPTRRLAVVRGTLEAAPVVDVAGMQAACIAAVKRAADLLVDVVPFHLTHCEVAVDQAHESVTVTVTVQAYARAPLSPAALLGAAAALATCRPSAEAALHLHVVQDVDS